MDVRGALWIVIGLAYVGAGLFTAIRYRRSARAGARFHQRMARVLPWLYKWPPGNLFVSEAVWRPMSVVVGLFVAFIGVLILLNYSGWFD